MFNIGGGEFLIIFLVALVVLGPTKLPEAARQAGKIIGEFRRMSSGFQREIQSAMNDPVSKLTGEPTPRTIKDVTSVAEVPKLDDAEPASPSELPSKKPASDSSDGSNTSIVDRQATSEPDETEDASGEAPAKVDTAKVETATDHTASDDTSREVTSGDAPETPGETIEPDAEATDDPSDPPVMYGDR